MERLKALFSEDDLLDFVLKTQIEAISCTDFICMEAYRILYLISRVKDINDIQESDKLNSDLKIHRMSYPQLRIEFNKVLEKLIQLDLGDVSGSISHQEIDKMGTAGDCLKLLKSKVTCKNS